MLVFIEHKKMWWTRDDYNACVKHIVRYSATHVRVAKILCDIVADVDMNDAVLISHAAQSGKLPMVQLIVQQMQSKREKMAVFFYAVTQQCVKNAILLFLLRVTPLTLDKLTMLKGKFTSIEIERFAKVLRKRANTERLAQCMQNLCGNRSKLRQYNLTNGFKFVCSFDVFMGPHIKYT